MIFCLLLNLFNLFSFLIFKKYILYINFFNEIIVYCVEIFVKCSQVWAMEIVLHLKDKIQLIVFYTL